MSRTPYGLMADLHLHNWNQFADTMPDGMNSRLHGLLSEIRRCASEVKAAGGNTIYVAGDVFHVRGSVAPSVLNPACDMIREITADGITVVIIPGNHDLEGKQSTRLGSAVTALEGAGAVIHNGPQIVRGTDGHVVVVVPWVETQEELKTLLEDITAKVPTEALGQAELLLHAPINGVIAGLPNTGLDPTWLAGLGFRRVFSGHYHNHKDFENGVFSIGALAHHSFSDIGSKAGFLIVGDDVRWMASHLPQFQDLDKLAMIDEESIPLMVAGNYVRVKTDKSKVAEIEGAKAELLGFGAKAVIVQSVPKASATRASSVTASVSAGASITTSVTEWINTQPFNTPAVHLGAQQVLAEAGI